MMGPEADVTVGEFNEYIKTLQAFLLGIDRGSIERSRPDLAVLLHDIEEKLKKAKGEAGDLQKNLRETISYLETRKRLGNTEEIVAIDTALRIISEAQKKEVITREDVETALSRLSTLRNNLNTMVGGIDALKAATENLIEALKKADAGSGKLRTIIKVVSVCVSCVALVTAASSAYGLVATMAGGGAAGAGLTTIDTGTLVAAGAGTDIVARLGRQREILSELNAIIAGYFGPKKDFNSYYREIAAGMGELTTIASSLTEGVKGIGSPERIVLPESIGSPGYMAKAASVISYANLAFSAITSLRDVLGRFRVGGKKDPLDVAMDEFLNAVEKFLKLQTLSLDNPPLRREPVRQPPPPWIAPVPGEESPGITRGSKHGRYEDEEDEVSTLPRKRPTGPTEDSSAGPMVEDRNPTKPHNKGSRAEGADRKRRAWERHRRLNLDRIEPKPEPDSKEGGLSSKRPR